MGLTNYPGGGGGGGHVKFYPYEKWGGGMDSSLHIITNSRPLKNSNKIK